MAKAKKKAVKKAALKKVAKKAAPKKAAKAKVAPKKAAKAKPPSKSAKPTKPAQAQQYSNVIPLHGRKRNWTGVISPLDDRVLLEIETEERITPGGLFIPDSAQMAGNFRGKVVAVGRGHLDKKGRIRPLDLQVGDRVLIQQWSGNEIVIDGEKLRLVRESEVLGTLE